MDEEIVVHHENVGSTKCCLLNLYCTNVQCTINPGKTTKTYTFGVLSRKFVWY